MATVHANKILTKFMLLLGGYYHCVKVSSNSETVRGMAIWQFSGALRELVLSIWTMEAPSKMTTHFKCEIFYRRSKCLKANPSFTTKTMRHIRLSPIPPPKHQQKQMLSYQHKIDWRRLTYVCYGSFMGSETLETYILRQGQ